MANILFITKSLGYGGAAKMLGFVASSLSSRQHTVCVVNLNATGSSSDFEQKLSASVRIELVTENGRKAQILAIQRIAKDFGADVLVGFTEIPNVLVAVVSLMTGIPSVVCERGDPVRTGVGKGLKNKIALCLINSSRGGVFQTDGARSFYGKGLRKRGVVIPNPIFVQGELPSISFEEREKSVVSVGRFDNLQKRYDVMIDAFAIFSQNQPDYVLKLYGSGPDEDLIRRQVAVRGLDEKVKFMGLTTQPMQDICRDGMFLITSDYEGISNSLLEAMATGLPCVSTDHTPGGAKLLITPRENGLLAPIGDAKALAEAMEDFAKDEELAKKCSKNAKDVVNRFAPEKIISAWESYLVKIIEKYNYFGKKNKGNRKTNE